MAKKEKTCENCIHEDRCPGVDANERCSNFVADPGINPEPPKDLPEFPLNPDIF